MWWPVIVMSVITALCSALAVRAMRDPSLVYIRGRFGAEAIAEIRSSATALRTGGMTAAQARDAAIERFLEEKRRVMEVSTRHFRKKQAL